MAKVSIDECRRILGAEAQGMSDADVEKLRDSLESAADALYAQITDDLRSGVSSIEEWRRILGSSGESISDAEIQSAAIDYAAEGGPEQEKRNAIERLRWIAHHQNTGEHE